MKLRSFIPFALLLTLLAGCKKDETATDTSATTPTTEATATTATTSSAAASVSDDDKNFAMKAAEGGMGEVKLGELAASKATNADVKAFGQRMQTDHGKAGDELKQWATMKNVTLPATLNAEMLKTYDELSKKSGAAFDKAYMEDMVKDHDKDVGEFKDAQSKVKDPDLKAWIDKTLPVIEGHQTMAHDLVKKLK